ncbi:MAG: division/cell wall cluster transcriptional repressor MraZ [Cytophagales bacterium]
MAYFSGEYECTIDAKGRMLLPSKVKSRLPENFSQSVMLTKSPTDDCLLIYSLPEWEKVAQKITSLNEFDENTSFIQRNFLRFSNELDLDALGRFLIPKKLLEFASITKEAVMVGLGNRLELWEPQRYEQSLVKDRKELATLMQTHLGSGR